MNYCSMYIGTHLENFMHTKQVGDIAEAAIILRALEKGWSVSKPIGENQRYDLIIDDGSTLHKVQCKSAKLTDNIIVGSISRISRNGDVFVRHKYTTDEIDVFALYCPDVKECYWISCKDLMVDDGNVQSSIKLRIKQSSGNNQHKTRLAKDYIL